MPRFTCSVLREWLISIQFIIYVPEKISWNVIYVQIHFCPFPLGVHSPDALSWKWSFESGSAKPFPSPLHHFLQNFLSLANMERKKTPKPAKQLKERLCTVWNSKIKSCNLLQPVTSEQTADSPAAPSPADCPELGGLSKFHLLALPRQFFSGFRCCLSEERESHTWGPIWMCPSQVTSASARLRSSLSQGAFLPPFDPEGTFVLIFSLLCYCFLGFASYLQSKERKKIFREIKISLQKIFF